ncbi:MAG: diguanylate cyclase [Dehalococcoidia bacterium]|nr:diguanylate cyclase [Dehalococcoidia bacterium]
MNSNALIPLAATIAYVPLLLVSLFHRPWQRQQGYFVLYLIPAILWSFSDFMLRSDLLHINDTLLVKVIVCMGFWMVIQFHYVLSSQHSTPGRIPLMFLPLLALIALAALDTVPSSVTSTEDTIAVDYGFWILLIAIPVIVAIFRDFYLLARKRKAATQPAERNQLTYFLAITAIGTIFLCSSLTDFGVSYAVAHIGNLITALILLYATAAHQLLDVGAAFRKALLYAWLTLVAVLTYLLLFWIASEILTFRFDWVVVIVGITATFCCIMLVSAVSSTSRRAIEELFTGQRYDYRQRLLQFVISIYNIADLKEFSNQFLSLLCHSTGAQNAWLLLLSPEDGVFRSQAQFSEVRDSDHPLVLRPDSPLIERLSQETAPLSQREINVLPEFASLWGEEKKSIESARIDLFFPLRNEDRLIGVVAMSKKRRGEPYTYEEIELITYALSSVGPGIDREHLREQLQARQKSLTLVNELMLIMSSSIDISEAFDRFSEQLGQVVPIDWAAISLADEDQLHILAINSNIPSSRKPHDRLPLAGTGTELAMKQQRAVYEPDLAKGHAFVTGERHLKQGLRSIIYLPLIYAGKSLGSLTLGSRYPQAYKDGQVKLLEHLAMQITPPIANSQLYAQAREKARLDELTGLFNRRHFDERIREEINRQVRYGGAFSLIMLDLDSFKAYNDVYGHPAGDTLLQEIGSLIKKAIRTSDQAFRYGGDEFAALLPQTDTDSAYHVAERIRQEVAAHAQAKSTGVTCSVGISSCPSDGEIPADLISAADSALYHSKYAGGNRVHISSSIMPAAATRKADDGEARSPSLAAIYALASAVDAKDHYTYAHSQRVKDYVVTLAQALGLPTDAVNRLSAAALLHDIGKIGVRDSILTKSGALTTEEFEEVKTHPRLAVAIISNVPSLAPCVPAILYHHERFDGTGYPQGLKGEEIPLEARILAIPDCLADMTADRSYRPALDWDEAMEEISRNSGTQFDPNIVKVFISLMESGAIPRPSAPGK